MKTEIAFKAVSVLSYHKGGCIRNVLLSNYLVIACQLCHSFYKSIFAFN